MPALFTAQGGRGGGGSYRGATRLRLVSISLGLTANGTPRQDRLLWRESFISAPPRSSCGLVVDRLTKLTKLVMFYFSARGNFAACLAVEMFLWTGTCCHFVSPAVFHQS